MSENIKELREEVKFYKRLSEVLLFKSTEKEKITLKNELLLLLKEHLNYQDIKDVAKELKVSFVYVENVLNDKCIDNEVINLLYNKALFNKDKLFSSYKKMLIDLKK